MIEKQRKSTIKCPIIAGIIGVIAIIVILLSTGVFGSLETIIRVLKTTWKDINVAAPTLYGWFHIMFICITIMVTTLLVVFARKVDDKKYRFIVFGFWALIFIFEIFKEVLITYKINADGHVYVDYDWIQFPFQFCSTPYFALPFIIFLKEGKIRKAFEIYSAIFMFVGGFATYCFPKMVFFESVFLSVQSLIHHGSMFALSIYIAVYNKKDLCLRKWIPSFAVFIGFVIIAIILNEVMWQVVPDIHKPDGKVFNMFFISPHFSCNLPVFKEIFNNPAIPKWVSIIIFMLGFGLLSYVAIIIYSLIINHTIKPCFSFKKSFYNQNANNSKC